MKKVLFWIVFIPYGLVMLTVGILGSIFSDIDDWMYHTGIKFEDWCFNQDTWGL